MAKKNEVDRSYREYIDLKRVPILPLDNRWHQLFPEKSKPPKIKKLEKQVMTLVKREGTINNDIKKLEAAKKKLMQEIVKNMQESSEEIDEKLRQKKLSASQKLIGDINKKSDSLENERFEIPEALVKANEELLIESIDLCYDRLSVNQTKISSLAEWIENARSELKKNIVLKQELEEMNASIYSYMHDMLGPRFMEVFDSRHEFQNQHAEEDEEFV